MNTIIPKWPLKSPTNIIVRMPNWLGDLVMATPILQNLRKYWPEANITAMCQSNVAALLKEDPNINNLYSYTRPSGWVHAIHNHAIINNLQFGEYDLGVLLTNSFSSALWFWRGNVKNRIGYAASFRSWLLNKAVPFPREIENQHLVKTYKMLLEPMGIPEGDSRPALYLSLAEQQEALNLLQSLGVNLKKNIIIGINPGAAYGSAKCWLPDRFKNVTHHLLDNPNYIILYFADAAGAPLVHQICQGMPERVINLAGKTSLRELMALIQKCNVFLTNDSGPMHIAAALNTPLVALFGSTSDIKTGPSYGKAKVIHKHVECSPCYKRVCPRGPADFQCMLQIEENEVLKALQEYTTERSL